MEGGTGQGGRSQGGPRSRRNPVEGALVKGKPFRCGLGPRGWVNGGQQFPVEKPNLKVLEGGAQWGL